MTEIHYLGLAYMTIWLLIGILGVILFRRLKRNEIDLADLRDRIGRS